MYTCTVAADRQTDSALSGEHWTVASQEASITPPKIKTTALFSILLTVVITYIRSAAFTRLYFCLAFFNFLPAHVNSAENHRPVFSEQSAANSVRILFSKTVLVQVCADKRRLSGIYPVVYNVINA